MPSPMLFLSHAGSDTEAARRLRDALLRAEAAKAAGLKVWFDKVDMVTGEPWQPQLERAIEAATVFAVYVGASGVINWVEAEVRLAQTRAIGGHPPLPFVPVLSHDSRGVEALPGFARQFQGVEDVEANGFDNDAFRKLLAVAVGKAGEPGRLVLETEPFFGLEPIREERSHLFFGRDAEVAELAERLAKERLLLIAGDSGSGKSSLVRAGLIPAWRGGVIAERAGRRPDAELWHVIGFRPRNNPRRQLYQAVSQAAARLGRSPVDADGFAQLTKAADPDTVRAGLRCGLDPEITRTLVFVDQFEELVIQTPEPERRELAKLLLDLADPDDPAFTVVMTMRSDYANLLYGKATRALHEALNARAEARYTLRGVSEAGLREIVRRPLRLAGRKEAKIDAVVAQLSQDVGDRPGDLALVQFALTRMWESRNRFGDDLVEAYVRVGGVRGALAREAERVYRDELGGDDNEETIAAALIRLGQLGDVGGVTRRLAAKAEFSERGWEVMQRLAGQEGNRLVLIGTDENGDERVEIAHEALLTQWERLHSWLNRDAESLRQLYQLAARTSRWKKRPASDKASDGDLATGSYLDSFVRLSECHPEWLSSAETAYVEASKEKRERALEAKRRQLERERTLREAAEARELQALRNESSTLTALANVSLEQDRYHEAKVLALSAWPRDPDDKRPGELGVTWDTLVRATVKTRQLLPNMGHDGPVLGAQFNADETAILSWSTDGTVRLWDAASGAARFAPLRHDGWVEGAQFNAEETAILSWSTDRTVRLWDAASGAALLAAPLRHEGRVEGVRFNAEETAILSWSNDGTVRQWKVPDIVHVGVLETACAEFDLERGFYPTAADYGQAIARYGIEITDPICKGLPPLPKNVVAPE